MIKRLHLVVFAVLFMCGTVLAQPGYRSSAGIGDILGQKGQQDEGTKIFRMVRYVPVTYSGATTLAADSVVVWDITNDDGITVTTTTTSHDSAIAGIIVQNALTPDTDGNTAAQDRGGVNWTWLQTYGLSQVDVADSVLAGDAFATSATAGEAATYVASTINPKIQGNGGFFVDAAANGTNNVQVFIILD